ncbi:hypothetical protein C8R46DRAFT_1042439 [Mycena filopes]|nr:hypothetical protein C8R46DRAFT_1042439 [Mycena filopes]
MFAFGYIIHNAITCPLWTRVLEGNALGSSSFARAIFAQNVLFYRPVVRFELESSGALPYDLKAVMFGLHITSHHSRQPLSRFLSSYHHHHQAGESWVPSIPLPAHAMHTQAGNGSACDECYVTGRKPGAGIPGDLL